MHCASDTRGAVATRILEALRRAAMERACSKGADALFGQRDLPFPRRFDTIVRVFPRRTAPALRRHGAHGYDEPAPLLGPAGRRPATTFATTRAEAEPFIDRAGLHP